MGAGVYDTEKTLMVAVTNTGGAAVVFGYSTGGAKSTAPLQDVDSTNNLGAFLQSGAAYTARLRTGNAFTVNPGETKYAAFEFTVKKNAGSTYVEDGSKSWSFTIPYYEGDTRKTMAVLTRTVLVSSNSSTVLFTGSGAGNTVTLSGTPYPLLGAINIGVAPPSGKITVTGGHYGDNGAASYAIYVDKVKKAEWTGVGGVPGLALPNLVWTTTTPALFEEKKYFVSLNGQGFAEGVIYLDVDGGFDLTFDAGPAEVEYIQDIVLDPLDEETPLPVNNDDGMNEDIVDESHVREDPEPVNDLGTDPKEDETSNDTVKDEYRAVRAAVEDALDGPAPSFDFDKWADPGPNGRSNDEDGPSGDGEGNGSSVGDGIASGASMIGAHPLTVPGTGTTTGLTFHIVASGATATMLPPAWAGSVRAVILIICLILFFLAMLATVKSAFAGR